MPRPRRDEGRANLAGEIKRVAREQMAEHGTAGVSLRGIARALDITAPAIYNYYPRLDDLITALIVDAFTDFAAALEEAAETAPGSANRDAIFAATLRYRAWALERPVEFQLIYGNPIPGYAAPFDVTAPLARRPFAALGRYFLAAWQSGELTLPVGEANLPESIRRHLEEWRRETGIDVPTAPLYAVIAGWTRFHGMVMLELFHHTQPTVGDTEAFYRHEVNAYLDQLGLPGS
jgi:AcrR family transcriptional regulator